MRFYRAAWMANAV